MTEEIFKSLFTLANIKVERYWRLQNRYWGIRDAMTPEFAEYLSNNPWWLAKTPYGLIEIGDRKRVTHIGWEDTKYRGIITPDDVTKDEIMVHAWTTEKALEYLNTLRKNLDELEADKN